MSITDLHKRIAQLEAAVRDLHWIIYWLLERRDIYPGLDYDQLRELDEDARRLVDLKERPR